jgi:hypothetical protein
VGLAIPKLWVSPDPRLGLVRPSVGLSKPWRGFGETSAWVLLETGRGVLVFLSLGFAVFFFFFFSHFNFLQFS